MIEKEVAELRRQLKPERSPFAGVYGCYVSETGEIISTFAQSLGTATQEEGELYVGLLKKALSGSIGRNLLDISFSTQQVVDSPEHKRLMHLRETKLQDEAARKEFYDQVIASLSFSENYLILLACGAYDVPFRGKDGKRFNEGSDEVFTYLLCSICPVKKTRAGLGYDYQEKGFRSYAGDWLVGTPQLGFLFPAFDDRSTNIYNALYYSRSLEDNHPELVEGLFHTPVAKPAMEQKKSFEDILSSSLEEECSLQVVNSVRNEMADRILLHKESKAEEPLTVSRKEVQQVLENCGVSEERLAAFNVKFDSEFGTDQPVSPENIVDTKHLELRTPDVVIQVNPERSDLIRTRVVGGARYIMILADESVEVNGVSISIPTENS